MQQYPIIYHITCVTHNSRESDRMKKYKVKRGDPLSFSTMDEVFITKCFADLVKKKKYKILTYNICKDHIHFVIVCTPEKIVSIVQNIKSITSRKFNERCKTSNLWAQKFNRKVIKDREQLRSVLIYIRDNRIKHNLEENRKLQAIVDGMITSIDSLFD
jgi:REP element-mobilizing transposase RayT